MCILREGGKGGEGRKEGSESRRRGRKRDGGREAERRASRQFVDNTLSIVPTQLAPNL